MHPIINCIETDRSQCASGFNGPASCFKKNNRPGRVGIQLDGTHVLGPYCRVTQRLMPCHMAPRFGYAPSAPPMQKSLERNSPGPIVLAKAGISVKRLLKLCNAFCSIVKG